MAEDITEGLGYRPSFYPLVPSSPPQDVVLTVVSANEIKVSWNEVLPINQSGIIILYGVLYQPMEAYDRSSLVQNTTNSSIALRGLHEYANYSVQVQAYTVIGPGPFSNQQSIRTNETGIAIMNSSALSVIYLILIT